METSNIEEPIPHANNFPETHTHHNLKQCNSHVLSDKIPLEQEEYNNKTNEPFSSIGHNMTSMMIHNEKFKKTDESEEESQISEKDQVVEEEEEEEEEETDSLSNANDIILIGEEFGNGQIDVDSHLQKRMTLPPNPHLNPHPIMNGHIFDDNLEEVVMSQNEKEYNKKEKSVLNKKMNIASENNVESKQTKHLKNKENIQYGNTTVNQHNNVVMNIAGEENNSNSMMMINNSGTGMDNFQYSEYNMANGHHHHHHAFNINNNKKDNNRDNSNQKLNIINNQHNTKYPNLNTQSAYFAEFKGSDNQQQSISRPVRKYYTTNSSVSRQSNASLFASTYPATPSALKNSIITDNQDFELKNHHNRNQKTYSTLQDYKCGHVERQAAATGSNNKMENGSVMMASSTVQKANASLYHHMNQENYRQELYRLSQNPWRPSTVFSRNSRPPSEFFDFHSQFRSQLYDANSSLHYGPNAIPVYCNEDNYNIYKFRKGFGIFTIFRKYIFRIGRNLIGNFCVWLVMVAALAGLEGYKDRSQSLNYQNSSLVPLDQDDASSQDDQQHSVNDFMG